MSGYRLVGGRIMDPSRGVDERGDLWVRDGLIVADDGGSFAEIACEGRVITPGFVAIHSHLSDLNCDGEAALRGGFTTVALTPECTAGALQLQASAPREGGPKLLQTGALSAQLKGEQLSNMGTLLDSGAVLLSHDRAPVADSGVLRNLLQYAAGFGATVFLRPGDTALERGPVREGEISAVLGMRGTPPQAEAIDVWRIAMLADLTGCRVHLTHLWSAMGVDALRAAQSQGVAITGSTTALHLTQDPMQIGETYAGHWRSLPPLGDGADREALRNALADGTLCAVAADHRPLAPSAQDRPFAHAAPGSITLEVAAALCIDALGLELAIRVLTMGPAALVGQRATTAIGSPANLTLINPVQSWRYNTNEGRASQRNTALNGTLFNSRVVGVFRDGNPLEF